MNNSRINTLTGYFLKKRRFIMPTAVFVEPTNYCNLKCPICPHLKMSRPKGMMDLLLFKRIVANMKGRVDVIILHFMGESLLHPQLPEFIRHAADNGLFVQLSTNGVLLTAELAGEIFEAGLDLLSIDFDGETPAEYQKIRENSSFETVLGNIKSAVRERQKKPGRKKCAISLQIIVFPGQKKNLLGYFTEDELKNLEIRHKQFNDNFMAEDIKVPHKRACFHLWNDMTIAWNGDVALCCVDYDCTEVLGNISESPIEEIWNNEKINELRQIHLSLNHQMIPMCGSCTLPNQHHFNPLYIVSSLLAGPKMTRKLMTPALNLLNRFNRL